MAAKIAAMMASTPNTTVATASSSMSITSDKELAATITTQQPAAIKSDVIMLNTMIHSAMKTIPLNMTAAARRRAGLEFDAGRAAGSGGLMTAIPLAMRVMSPQGRKRFNRT